MSSPVLFRAERRRSRRPLTAFLAVLLGAGTGLAGTTVASAQSDEPSSTAGTESVVAASTSFRDTAGTTHRPGIDALAADGIIRGCDTDRFCPDSDVTRGQLATILSNALALPAGDLPDFRDVAADDVHARSIGAVVEAGIFRGVSDDRFAPSTTTSRAQLATVLVRAFEVRASSTVAAPEFRDIVGSVHAASVRSLAEAGVARGCAADRYCPSADVSRGQAATLLAFASGRLDPADFPTPAPVTAGDRGALLSRREGFGRNAGQGAESFSEVTVTNLNDSGSGSLRDALSTGSRWITFEPGLSGTIDLGSTLDVPSDVVIDGRGADITLAADSSTVILSLYRADNIIVTNLKLDGGYDGIQIYQGTTNVWIDHITATAAADEVIGITGETERPDLITVSWSRFDNAGKVMLLSGSEYDINHSSDRVTLHHNLYNRSFDRHPLVRFSRVHAYNNWLYQWGREGTGQGIRVGNQGQFRSEANIYDDVHGRPALIPEDMGTYGNAISIGDVTTGDPEIQERNPDQVFDPADHYSYSLDTPGDALRAELSANAGWQPTN